MTSTLPQNTTLTIRPFQNRDMDEIERLFGEGFDGQDADTLSDQKQDFQHIRRWHGVLKCFSLFPNPLQHALRIYVAEQGNQLQGVIQVSPFNHTRSTWKVDRVLVSSDAMSDGMTPTEVGSQLLRYCFQNIWEARTWVIEVNVSDNFTLALYRQNGFQPLAHLTYWEIAAELLDALAEREPDLPNLLPISNADACLLHQLDTVSMPPLLRQVFDRHIVDFKSGLVRSVFDGVKRWANRTEVTKGYVFETQRKAAIGYFQMQACRDGLIPHTADLTVHPAYTWLYPELLTQMARVAKAFPAQSLRLASTDYQAEREEYLVQLGAERTEHTLLMSRSVWHKLKEAKPMALEGLQLSDVLQSLQPARKPVPGRFSLLETIRQLPQISEMPRLASEQDGVVPPSSSDATNNLGKIKPSQLPEEPS